MNYWNSDKPNTFNQLKNSQCIPTSYMLKNMLTIQGSSQGLQLTYLTFSTLPHAFLSFNVLHKLSCLTHGPQTLLVHCFFCKVFTEHELHPHSSDLIQLMPFIKPLFTIVHRKFSTYIACINEFTIHLDGNVYERVF